MTITLSAAQLEHTCFRNASRYFLIVVVIQLKSINIVYSVLFLQVGTHVMLYT